MLYYMLILTVICMSLNHRVNSDTVIGGGKYANIEDFPHSVSLGIRCKTFAIDIGIHRCGGSILNQRIILTAGHCLSQCSSDSQIIVNVGNNNKRKGFTTKGAWFITHEKFNNFPMNDLAIVYSDPKLPLDKTVRRVALMETRPHKQLAMLAGWGMTDEEEQTRTHVLKFTPQKIVTTRDCTNTIHDLPPGVICGISWKNVISDGDSGSALIVDDYIQIGVVSFKVPDLSNHLNVYSDIAYHYKWIKDRAERAYCHKSKKVSKKP